MGVFVFVLQYAFKTIRPIFRERGKINAEVTGRLTESLGGVRVIKGYHAEEREANVFAGGVERLLEQRDEVADHDQRAGLGVNHGAGAGLGALSCGWAAIACWAIPGRSAIYFRYNMFLAFMIAPVFQIVNIGTQLTEAFAGLDRTNEIMSELEENQTPGRTMKMPPIEGNVRFDDVEFAYTPEKPVLHGISFDAEPGTVTALVGSSGSGKSTIISLVCAFHTPTKGRGAGGRHRPGHGGPQHVSLAAGRGAAGLVPV